MKGYSEQVFDLRAMAIYERARAAVDKLPFVYRDSDPKIRCHELARAVFLEVFDQARVVEGGAFVARMADARVWVVDGKYGHVEHSWIEIANDEISYVLDVYACARLPQVQIIHRFLELADLYIPGKARDDIDDCVIQDIQSWWRYRL